MRRLRSCVEFSYRNWFEVECREFDTTVLVYAVQEAAAI